MDPMWVGALAAVCSTTAFVPQSWKLIRTGDTKALSRPMYIITVIGFALWSAYGTLRTDWTLVVPNLICLALPSFILVRMLRAPRGR